MTENEKITRASQILRLKLRGLADREVSDELGISESTIIRCKKSDEYLKLLEETASKNKGFISRVMRFHNRTLKLAEDFQDLLESTNDLTTINDFQEKCRAISALGRLFKLNFTLQTKQDSYDFIINMEDCN